MSKKILVSLLVICLISAGRAGSVDPPFATTPFVFAAHRCEDVVGAGELARVRAAVVRAMESLGVGELPSSPSGIPSYWFVEVSACQEGTLKARLAGDPYRVIVFPAALAGSDAELASTMLHELRHILDLDSPCLMDGLREVENRLPPDALFYIDGYARGFTNITLECRAWLLEALMAAELGLEHDEVARVRAGAARYCGVSFDMSRQAGRFPSAGPPLTTVASGQCHGSPLAKDAGEG